MLAFALMMQLASCPLDTDYRCEQITEAVALVYNGYYHDAQSILIEMGNED